MLWQAPDRCVPCSGLWAEVTLHVLDVPSDTLLHCADAKLIVCRPTNEVDIAMPFICQSVFLSRHVVSVLSIAHLYGAFEDSEYVYCVTELCTGVQSLDSTPSRMQCRTQVMALPCICTHCALSLWSRTLSCRIQLSMQSPHNL